MAANVIPAHFGLMLVGTWTESICELGEPCLIYNNLVDLIDVSDRTFISSSILLTNTPSTSLGDQVQQAVYPTYFRESFYRSWCW